MVAWWRRVFGDLPGDEQGPQDTLSLATQTEVPTPMPPDRSADVSPERLEDAVQEFLTDWLVRREWDEALAFLSDTAYACINIDDDARYEALDKDGTRAALRDTMTYAVDMIEKPENLTEAIDAVRPPKPNGLIAHAFDGEFSMRELDPAEAAQEYRCAQQQTPVPGRSYYSVAFRFKGRDAAALGLLWTQVAGQWKQVAGQWKLLSYQVFEI